MCMIDESPPFDRKEHEDKSCRSQNKEQHCLPSAALNAPVLQAESIQANKDVTAHLPQSAQEGVFLASATSVKRASR